MCQLRACSKILKFDQETRKITEFSEKSKTKNLLVTVETQKKDKQVEERKNVHKIYNFVCLASSRQCENDFSKNEKSSSRPDI